MVFAIIGIALIMLVGGMWVARIGLIARSRHPGVLLFVPDVTPMLVGAVLAGGVLIAVSFLTITGFNYYCFTAPLLIGLLILGFRVPYLAFYVLDEHGIQHNLLGRQRIFAWNAIDWVYGEQSSTITRTRGARYVRRGTPIETRYVLEAGPKHRITIPLGMSGDAQQVNRLMQMIGQHATNALVGRNRLNDVRARRAANAGAPSPMHHGTGSAESAHR